MNRAILMGRLARDPEIRTTQSGIPVCNFTVACDRRSRAADGSWQNQADFIPCVAWRQQAEFINRYFSKGDRILVSGSIQPRSWEDDKGNRRYTTEVIIDEVEFCESKRGGGGRRDDDRSDRVSATTVDSGGDSFLPAPDDDTSLPFDF
ncbi:MAG TPA: single-stranded DNA-binding protein [Clostridiaceae bacterium]|nr:single-stranded DNA-binding protein [Clostridiaceae bacterium]